MLTIQDITSLLVNQFNQYAKSNNYGKTLAIFENFATAQYDSKEINSDTIEYAKQYGIIRTQTSQIGTVGGLPTVTGSLAIDILVDISKEDDDGRFPEVSELVYLIDSFAMQYAGKYINVASGGNNYAVLPVISAATVGFYQEDSSNWGAHVPVSFSIAFTALQGGTSSSEIGIEIDGHRLYCDLVLTRVKTSSSDVKSVEKNGSTRVSDDSTTFEIELTAPFQDNDVCDELFAEMLDGRSNAPHLVEIIRVTGENSKSYLKCYMMSFAKAQMTSTSGSLVGINANLLELDNDTSENDINLPTHNPKWHGTTITTDDQVGSLSLGSGDYCIFWGDGAGEYRVISSTPTTVTHTYKHDGTYTVRYFKK